MAGVKGSTAQSLVNPVVGADAPQPQVLPMPSAPQQAAPAPQAPVVNTYLSSMNQPSPQVNAPVPAPPSLDDIFGASANKPSLDDIFGGNAQQPDTDYSQHSDFSTRLAAGFASDDEQKKKYLEGIYGEKNVRSVDGEFQVKEKGESKFHPFNNSWLGIGDPANLGRTAVVEAGAFPAEAMAGAASIGEGASVAGAPAIVPTLAAGRVVGGATGEYLARGVAGQLGMEGKGAVNDALGAFVQGGMRALFGHVFDRFTEGGVKALTNDVSKNVSQTLDETVSHLGKAMSDQTEASMAQMKAVTPLDGIMPEKKALAGVQDALELNEAAKRTGIDLRPDELFPNEPKFQALAKTALSSPTFRESVMKRGQQAAQAVEQLGSTFQTSEDGSAQTAVKQGSVVDRAWGKLIGGFRDRAIANSEDSTLIPKQGELLGEPGTQTSMFGDGTNKIKMSNLADALDGLKEQFGFQGDVPPSTQSAISDIEQKLNLSTQPGKAKFIIGQISKLSDKLANNPDGLAPREVDQMYNMFKQLADHHFEASGGAQPQSFRAFATIKSGLRDDFTNGIASLLSPEEKAQYQSAMSRFSDVKTASEGVKQLFKTDSPSTSSIVEYLRNGGIKNADRIENLKTIIQQDYPEEWENIAKAYFDRTLADHRVDELGAGQRIGEVNWTKLVKTLDPDKKQFSQLNSIIGPDRASKLADLAKVMSTVQQNDGKFVNESAPVIKLLSSVRSLLTGDFPGVADALASNRAAMKLLNTDKSAALIQRYALKDHSLGKVISDAMEKYTERIAPVATGIAAQKATQELGNISNSAVQP